MNYDIEAFRRDEARYTSSEWNEKHQKEFAEEYLDRQIVAAASPGPWRNGRDPSHFDAPEVTDDKSFAYFVEKMEDAAFIARARTRWPAVLDKLNTLYGDRARYYACWHGAAEKLKQRDEECAKLYSSVAALEEELKRRTNELEGERELRAAEAKSYQAQLRTEYGKREALDQQVAAWLDAARIMDVSIDGPEDLAAAMDGYVVELTNAENAAKHAAQAVTEIPNLKRALETERAQREMWMAAGKEAQRLQTERDTLQAALNVANKRIDALDRQPLSVIAAEEKCKRLEKENTTLVRELNSAFLERDALKRSLELDAQSAGQLKDDFIDAQQEVNRLKERVERLTAMVEDARAQRYTAEDNLRALTEDLKLCIQRHL